MAKRDTLSLLDEYEHLGLDKGLFQHKLHPDGGSFDGFRRHSMNVISFKRLGSNQVLHDRLAFIVSQVRSGASADSSGLEKLIEQSWTEIPCSRYPNCRGHNFDPNCRHRK
jgi:hypothetical protein